MYRQSLFLVILSVVTFVQILQAEEKIEPVDIKYYCIEVEGKGNDKIPVLLVHSIGGSHKGWGDTNLHIALRTNRKVCTIDQRNHGDSPWNSRSDVKAYSVDILHFLDKQGMKKINIIGHSLGGKVSVDFTLNNPSRINSIVIEDMRPNGVNEEAHNRTAAYFKLLKETLVGIPGTGTEDEAKENLVKAVNEKYKKMGVSETISVEALNSRELKLVGDKWQFKSNIDAILEAMDDIKNHVSSGLYTGPALFIYGTMSPFKVNEDKDNILKLFPKAEFVPVEGAGHNIHREFPKFEDEVVKFLNGVN